MRVRAVTSPGTVGSVVFGRNANPTASTDNDAPYRLSGTLGLGTHSIRATPEPLPDTRGNACRDDHPAAQRLSANYGVSCDEVIRAFCKGFGFDDSLCCCQPG